MRWYRSLITACAVVLVLGGPLPGGRLQAQAPGQPPGGKEREKAASTPDSTAEPGAEIRAVTQAILEEIDKNSELMTNIEYLCDMIGPRLTGSPGLTRASHWTRDKLTQYGLANSHLEPWTIYRAWTRGEAQGRIVEPVEQRLLLESAGWSPSTGGPVPGPVIHVKAESADELSPYKGKLKGAWVLLQPVSVQPSPRQPGPASPLAAMMRRIRDYPKIMKFNQELKTFLAAEGAAGLLRDSNKQHGLINMTGATSNYTQAPYPEAFLATETYGLIWRLLKRGPVTIELDLKNTLSNGPVEVYNTVAELPGTEKPDEVVIIGGHIDSWDLATGATDDGTGIMAVLEAARALKAVGVKPNRTIRFVMFSGEEQGLHGSRAYVRVHEKELPKISAVLVHDMGTGRVKSIGLLGRYDLRETMDKVVEPFKDAVKLEELSMGGIAGGTDHASFLPHGVPAFAVIQDEAEYPKTHHTQSDTVDKVYPDEINQGAKVLAAWAYNVAMLPRILPRNPKPARPSMFDAPQFQQPGDKSEPSPARRKPDPTTASAGASSGPRKP
jgi:carboxypeptidase Q